MKYRKIIICIAASLALLMGCEADTASSVLSSLGSESVASVILSSEVSEVESVSVASTVISNSTAASSAVSSTKVSKATSHVASSMVASSVAASVAASSIIASSVVTSVAASSSVTSSAPSPTTEMRGVWISYIELTNLGGYDQYKTAINSMFDKIKAQGINTIFFHARAFSDALYKSDYYPWSHVLNSGAIQGVNPGYDPLEYAVGAAHARGLELHAWINPYRVWTKSSNINDLAVNNPARIWETDASTTNDNWVLTDPDKVGIYYNPAIPEVRELIINGIKEIVKNYDVDGIHFDDYFYGSSSELFDASTYSAYKTTGGSLSLSSWRIDNVNKLIKDTYTAVKSIRDIPFGISPQAKVSSDYAVQFADVNRWGSESGYVDYLAPQVYFGFQNATMPYAPTVQSWRALVTNPSVKLYIGLAAYKLGNDDYNAGASGLKEWIGTTDILKRMLQTARANNTDGFIIFSYKALVNSANATEMENLRSLY